MTNKEALDILKDRKIAYEVVITRTASHENRHMAEEELKLINACIIALEHNAIEQVETVDAIPVEWLLNHIPHDEPMEAYNKKLIEYLVIAWRKENESNIND